MFSQSDAPWRRNIIRVSGHAVFMSHFQKRPLVEITQDEVLQGPLFIHPIFAGVNQAHSLFLYCCISWLEEARKYPHSHMDLFPDHRSRSLNNFSKNTLKENKWTFNDKQFLWVSLYIYATQFHTGLTTKGLNGLQHATVHHPAKGLSGSTALLPAFTTHEGARGWLAALPLLSP